MDGEVATAVLPGWKARPENRAQADAQLRKLLEPRERLKQRELLRQQTGTDANNQSDDFEIDQLDGSLTVLSEQLYNKDTHFILELIQNADDNAYGASTIPSFGMRLDKNDGDCTFQTGCNEVGFTVEQIDALCRIASSTKKNEKDVRTGYIGEKGIGFKAVFKVADVVYIKSGFYSFKLDKRNGMVGTLLPLPADFPASKYHEHDRSATRMTLLLKGIEQYDKISKELTKIKPEILLFLRRLRSISIHKGQETTVYLAMHNEYEEKLQGETKTIDCQKQGESFRNKKFLITRTMVNDMPNEEKRADTYLIGPDKSSQIIEQYKHIPDADIPEPNDEKWRFLSNFSVIVEAKDEARIRELEVLRRVTAHENTLETVHPIYKYLAKNRSMMLNSTVKVGQIHGLSEDGKILIVQKDGFIDVYVLRDPFDNQDRRVSRELSKLFIDQYQITKPEHVTQLRDILGAKLSEMEDLLEEVGIRCPWSEETPEETTTKSRTVNVATVSPATSTAAKKVLQPVNVMGRTPSAFSSRPNGHNSTDRDRFKEIGVLGEAWMNEYFKKQISDWDPNLHWTSKLRVEKGYSDFEGDESKTADFTYTDEEGRMLPVMGLPSPAQDWGDKHITYHIEVKGTVLENSEPFHISQHQMDLALKYSKVVPKDIYVIARVYHLRANTRVRFYIDAWRYISAGRLKLRSEGYEVTPAEE
ncbi:hypothetical protein K4K59_010968 [Colletotrichum sp. SAR11_240]|nr:hypothetical protein K4K59_010968 [Colletotrichum sp. SAR11_240]